MKKPAGIEVSSPPCYAGQADPAYMGFLGQAEVIERLNLLLTAERAGRKACRVFKDEATDATYQKQFQQVERDEAFCCAMLARNIVRLGGVPSRKTGDFLQKILAIEGLAGRLKLLDRGQQWVANYVRDMLPKVGDEELYADLKEMLDQHERNIGKITVAS